MQFNSWIFLFLFLPMVLFMYFGLNKYKLSKIATVFLVISNLIFYVYANVAYALYFVLCIVVNYVIGKILINIKKKLILIIGIILNLGSLAVLKYCNFFISMLNLALKTDYNLVELFVPLGISFFTFQFIAFIYDCYKGEISKHPQSKSFYPNQP